MVIKRPGVAALITRNKHLGGARVGLIVPSVNTTIEPEFAEVCPPDVSFHTARVPLRATTVEGLNSMNSNVQAAARLLADIDPALVVFACTSGSFIGGSRGMNEQIDEIRSVTRCDVVSTSDAALRALSVIGARKVAVVTPYLEEVNTREKRFFEDNGFDVPSIRGLGLSGKAIREVSPEEIVEFVLQTNDGVADAIFISCTDFRAMEAIEHLEAKTGKPVVTSNQATYWAVLKALGIDTVQPRIGKLMMS